MACCPERRRVTRLDVLLVSLLIPAGLAVADPPAGLDCGYRSPAEWLAEVRAAVARGEIADPLDREIPRIAPRPVNAGPVDPTPCLTVNHLFLFEDTA